MSVLSAFFKPVVEQGLKAPLETPLKEVGKPSFEKGIIQPVSELDKPLGKEVAEVPDMETKADPKTSELDKPLGKEVSNETTPEAEEAEDKAQTAPRVETVEGRKHYYDDNGNLYRIDNELLPDNRYEVNGYQYETDEKGRITSVEGTLRLKERKGRLPIRDSIENIGKGDQREGDDRGHLIGDQFDGSNGLENMIPQDAKVNENDFKKFENHLAEEVKAGKEVSVKIDPIYEGDSHRPSDIVVTYSIDGKEDVRIFPNTKEAL